MTTTIVILGRANVGKSTLFNRLTGTRSALVVDQPGVTRDIQYGSGTFGQRNFTFIDTGGMLDPDETNRDISGFVSDRSLGAASEADAAFWLVDGRDVMPDVNAVLHVQSPYATALACSRPDTINFDVISRIYWKRDRHREQCPIH